MILTIIALALLVLGMIFVIISHYKGGWNWIDSLAPVTFSFGLMLSIIVIILLANAHINSDIKHSKKVAQHDAYERIVDSTDILYTDSDFYEDLINYNQDILRYKKWRNNPWVNWFFNDSVYEGLELVSMLPEGEEK